MKNDRLPPQQIEPGSLWVVATPLGNLADFSPRALEILQKADLILAEDTRVFSRLAASFNIRTPVNSFHDHNERTGVPRAVEKLLAGSTLALVSDAGTPLISDPGYLLVKACREKAIPVKTVPGPSSVVAALSVSGLESDRFYFAGFLPLRPGKKQKALTSILSLDVTSILFESPHRIRKTLEELQALAPGRELCLCRELTKIHEEVLRGTAEKILKQLPEEKRRGEMVLLIKRCN